MASHISSLPLLPAKHDGFISYLARNPRASVFSLVEPYKVYETKLRELFAQEPDHPVLGDHNINTVSVFSGHQSDLRVQARNLDEESEDEKSKYVMPLNEDDRKPNGSLAVVQSFKEFQKNFNIFSESSLVDLDWNNVVAAGSSVVTSLLPIPEQHSSSKKALREYYHQILAPASDVDLFIYGLTEEEGIEKIKQIETKIKDSILSETTTIRTKNAITIASQYPTRHVQIVLRIYKSVSEILTGFDVDCSCVAYDGKQVYASPRALASYITQINTIDLTRRSPSYESRLSKYSRRGFEVYWPVLDRSRIDPTIYERNFARTQGLARLLVLEKLPKPSDRDNYRCERRRERGRPAINRYQSRQLRGNLKANYDDEVAEWVEEDDVSNYHTFTIPYGEKFHARNIEKLLYTKDLLLNAEWNKPEDREVNLHRHPAFFGKAEDIIHDCCGYCPKPSTPEEEEIAKEEGKTFVSGEISFLVDNPGRQAIGSFNPITDSDWTEMAYIGNSARLCQAIVDGDLEHVQDWLAQEGANPNQRDHTGRTPLHLAVMSSTPEIVKCLVDHGSRMVSRLVDGRTALHIAAARGKMEMVKILLQKSEENEEEEANREELRRQTKEVEKKEEEPTPAPDSERSEDNSEDGEMIDNDEADSDDDYAHSAITGSFIKVRREKEKMNTEQDNIPEDEENEPDIIDINSLAWDLPCSPLHLAIVNGHCDVVRELVQTFGADVLLPIKLLNEYDRSPRAALLTMVLALKLPLERAREMVQTLLTVGATSAQADMNQVTAFHYFVSQKDAPLDILFEHDALATKRAISHLSIFGSQYNPTAQSPLMTAIKSRNVLAALNILNAGGNHTIGWADFVKSIQLKYGDSKPTHQTTEQSREHFEQYIEQPLPLAVVSEQPGIALQLLKNGANPNTLTAKGQSVVHNEYRRMDTQGETVLDVVQRKLKQLREYEEPESQTVYEPIPLKDEDYYLKEFDPASYKYFTALQGLRDAKNAYESDVESYKEKVQEVGRRGVEEKKAAIMALITSFEELEAKLLEQDAKTFRELYPDFPEPKVIQYNNFRYTNNCNVQPKPFEVTFDFHHPHLTDEQREAYIDLFEAAWTGDLNMIKSLTLAPWGKNLDQSPLRITTTDLNGFTLFGLAVLQGHLELAIAILQISQAQYKTPGKTKKTRYTIDHHEDDKSDISQDKDSDDFQVFNTIIDDQFTVENIGEVATQVKSDMSPLAFIQHNNPIWRFTGAFGVKPGTKSGVAPHHLASARNTIQYAIGTGNLELLVWLLESAAHYKKQNTGDDEESYTFHILDEDFEFAIKCGYTQILAEIIKRTGAGIPLEELAKKSGVEMVQKPKYYQGLSVHGKKRASWIAAARGVAMKKPTNAHPPLLTSIYKGNIDSVQWFLSDIPLRVYSEFVEAHPHDPSIKNLAQAVGGVDKSISSWLDTRNELVLHCAVLANPDENGLRIFKYILETFPEYLDKKSPTGQTPLALAFSMNRYSYAKALIEAGADQSTRDNSGKNLLHLLLDSIPGNGNICCSEHAEVVLRLHFDLIDHRLKPSLFIERTHSIEGGLTPLAAYVKTNGTGYGRNETVQACAVLKFLLSNNPGNEDLSMIDSAGDTPLHNAVRARFSRFLRMMLEHRPDLLYRENATGCTPAEMAEDTVIALQFQDAPTICGSDNYFSYHREYHDENCPIVEVTPENFVNEKCVSWQIEEYNQKEAVWEVCREFMATTPRKRKLVSLFDANEVAKRLAARQNNRHFPRKGRMELEYEGESETDGTVKDEIEQWRASALYFKDPIVEREVEKVQEAEMEKADKLNGEDVNMEDEF